MEKVNQSAACPPSDVRTAGPPREWWLKDSRPWVLFVGRFGLPGTGAPFHRLHMIARALRDEGYQAAFLPEDAGGRPEDRDGDGVLRHDGFPYFPVESAPETYGKGFFRFKRAVGAHNPGLDWMKANLPPAMNVHAVFSASLPSMCLRSLGRHFRGQSIPVIFDASEWYDVSSFPRWPLNPNYWDCQMSFHWVVPRLSHVVAISRLLEKFYLRRGCRVLRLPQLADAGSAPVRIGGGGRDRGTGLTVTYTGFPGRSKDRLWAVLEGAQLAREKGHDVRLRVVGPSEELLLSLDGAKPGILTALDGHIVFTGPVTVEIARQEMAAADFTVLVRPDLRYARAGFPTKVVESLCAGTPVILSPVGDVALYVQEGRDSVFVENATPEAVCHALCRAASMSRERRAEMRAAARKCAQDSFDYRAHAAAIAGFVGECRQGATARA